jgi:hypothetical protein
LADSGLFNGLRRIQIKKSAPLDSLFAEAPAEPDSNLSSF